LIVDPDGEYSSVKGVTEITLDEALEKCPKESYFNYSVVIDDEETIDADAEHLARLAMAIGDCTIIFEEIADYSGSAKIRTLFRRGRKLGVRCIAVSQRPAEVHKTVTSQCACVLAFHFDEPRDILYMKERFGRDASIEVQRMNPERYEVAVLSGEEIFREDFT
jgi:DNA helicase HerA-like ATPase